MKLEQAHENYLSEIKKGKNESLVQFDEFKDKLLTDDEFYQKWGTQCEVYNAYKNHFTGYADIPEREWVIENINTNSEFKEKFATGYIKELDINDRLEMYVMENPNGVVIHNDEFYDAHKIPKRIIL
jgi:hypothetical protein